MTLLLPLQTLLYSTTRKENGDGDPNCTSTEADMWGICHFGESVVILSVNS